MSEEIRDAIVAALKDARTKEALASAMHSVVDDQLKASLPDLVKGAVLGARNAVDEKPYDPYRTTLHFLAGLIAFSLAVIVGVFNALPDPPVDTTYAAQRMLGGVLGWMAITALVATVAALFTQLLKNTYRKAVAWWVELMLMGTPALSGAAAVVYCIRGGGSMASARTELIGLGEALCTLWPF
jgi:hypothetical protein